MGELVVSVAAQRMLPATIQREGPKAERRFWEFFGAQIRNPNTREAYLRAVTRFFLWSHRQGLSLPDIEPLHVAAYVETLMLTASRPTVKQHLAAIRMIFDWLVTGQIVPFNPASSVRGPKYIVKRGKTPVLTAEQARTLLDSISVETLLGLRDRALIATLLYSFARISAVCAMRVEDYYPQGKRYWLRLHEKGGKLHEVPCHHKAEEYLDAYLDAANLWDTPKAPLFRTIRKKGKEVHLTANKLTRVDAYRMILRRAKAAGIDTATCCHSFRATGITVYLENGGDLETAAQIAAHESPRTTKLYDRTNDSLTLDEIERIRV